MRSGRITQADGELWNPSLYGFWWSLRGTSMRYDGITTPSAYGLYFNATGVGSSGGPYNRYYGFPLRCLSTVLDMWYNVLQKGGEYIVKKF